jgi:hypothetical protein
MLTLVVLQASRIARPLPTLPFALCCAKVLQFTSQALCCRLEPYLAPGHYRRTAHLYILRTQETTIAAQQTKSFFHTPWTPTQNLVFSLSLLPDRLYLRVAKHRHSHCCVVEFQIRIRQFVRIIMMSTRNSIRGPGLNTKRPWGPLRELVTK